MSENLPHSCPNCGASMTSTGRLESLLVERDGDYLSYGQLRERLVEAESLVSRQRVEIAQLRDELRQSRDETIEARQAARIIWLGGGAVGEEEICEWTTDRKWVRFDPVKRWPWLEVNDE